MKVVVVGAGALGSLYAAYLARDCHDVSLVARGERARASATHGIPVTGAEEFTARCDIVTEPQRLRSADLFILTTKTYDTAVALQSLCELKVASKPRIRLACAVLAFTNPRRARCTASTTCIGAVFTGTKRIFGRPTALQIASASLRLLLFVFMYGFANCGAIIRTIGPSSASFRAQ